MQHRQAFHGLMSGLSKIPNGISEEGLLFYSDADLATGSGASFKLPNQVSGPDMLLVGSTAPTIANEPDKSIHLEADATNEMEIDFGVAVPDFTIYFAEWNHKWSATGQIVMEGKNSGGNVVWTHAHGWQSYSTMGSSTNFGNNDWAGKDVTRIIGKGSAPGAVGLSMWTFDRDFILNGAGTLDNTHSPTTGTQKFAFGGVSHAGTWCRFGAVAIYEGVITHDSAKDIAIRETLLDRYFPWP